jgi:hypothetical protein
MKPKHHYKPLSHRRFLEVYERAMRIERYLQNKQPPTCYKDIREQMGLSYRQTVEALEVLENLDIVHVSVITEWNGCHYIFPHHVWLNHPE